MKRKQLTKTMIIHKTAKQKKEKKGRNEEKTNLTVRGAEKTQ